MFQSPGRIFFDIFGFSVYYYSFFMALAILCGSFVTFFIAKKYYRYLNMDVIFSYTQIVIVCALIFARLYYVMLGWNYYSQHFIEIFMVWKGGLTIHGALFGGIFGGWIKTLMDKDVSFFKYCDVAPWGVLTGQIIGRWGNFFNSEAFGLPTNLPWKLYIAPEYRPFGYQSYEYFHPTFLYESIWNIMVFLFLFFVGRKLMKNVYGGVFFTYLILYSIGRILIESIRIDTISYIGNIPVPTFVSLIVIIVSACFLFYCFKNQKAVGLQDNKENQK